MKSREINGWMSVSDTGASPLALIHNRLQVYRINWLRAKAWVDRWLEEVKMIQNETTWMCLWLDYHRDIWEGRANESEEQGLKGHACYAWKQVWMWETIAKEAGEVFIK